MTMKSLDPIRTYYLKSFVISLLYIMVIFPVICHAPNLWSVLICAILYFPVKILIRIVANKTFASILFEKLDAFEFQRIVNDKRLVWPLAYRISAAISSGDYQFIVNIAAKQLRKKKAHIKVKYYYLCLLARAYFELRDFEKLAVLHAKYEEYKEQFPAKSFFRTPNSIWSYYQYFLNQNYEACKTICKERNLELKPKAWDTKIRKLYNDFLWAVACYENEETDSLIESFENIVSLAPRMYIASVSQKYLEAVESKQPLSLPNADVVPDENYQIHDERTAAKIRCHKLITSVGVVIVIVLLALTSIFDHMNTQDNGIYEDKLNDALIEQYGQPTKLAYFNVKKDGENVDALCLANIDDKLILVEVASKDEGQTFDALEVAESIIFDTYYCNKSPSSDYYIGFEITSKEPSTDSLYYLLEFEFNNNTYWFYIDYVEITKTRH